MSANILDLAQEGREVDNIPVSINYDIIRLFSEGLYRSPHKAIEELVSNGYDAGATQVHILLPEQPEGGSVISTPLWVIDNGHGMNVEGFHQLWRVADSDKDKKQSSPNERAPIGQFGIGKLAAYVLAWHLTHLSCVDGKLLLTTMNFHNVTGRQNQNSRPVKVSLREINEETAKTHLAEIKQRDPAAWALMFGNTNRSSSWTAAALTDFKELYDRLATGRLRWVLSTGLPLHTDFCISLNGGPITSSKETLKQIKEIQINETLHGLGEIVGSARIYEKPLTTGKAGQLGRSNGFFIRVRKRVINLEDELFGVTQPNHAAWSRFALEVDADGLREHLLSSREGVRDSEAIRKFREYLLDIFRQCRNAYDEWDRREHDQLDLAILLSDSPSSHVTELLFQGVRNTVETGADSFYIQAPQVTEENRSEWLEIHESQISEKPFEQAKFVKHGPKAPALRYDPSTRSIAVNSDHPFVDKLTDGHKHLNSAKLFAASEVLLEGQLQYHGISPGMVNSFIRDRDRVLRLTAGDNPLTAAEVSRFLEVANQNRNALERATGVVFEILGFKYERKGGNTSGPDGVLCARLGLHGKTPANYKLVYDAKQTNQPSVPADKVGFASMEDFRKQEDADYGFFIADAYDAEENEDGKLNREINTLKPCRLTLLKIEHLRRLINLHYRHGVTLTALRSLFDEAHTVPQVNKWMDGLENGLIEQGEVSLSILLQGLEKEKHDQKAPPNIIAVRAKNPELQNFEPDRLVARLKAVESIIGSRWIEVEWSSGCVLMHQTAEQLLVQLKNDIENLSLSVADELPEKLS